MSLCLIAGTLIIPLAAETITLAWTHSVERTRWEETWRGDGEGVHLVEARVQGSGAGMEPAPEATLKDGFWTWTPKLPPQAEIVLRRSEAVEDWRLCRADVCDPMTEMSPVEMDPISLAVCPAGPSRTTNVDPG